MKIADTSLFVLFLIICTRNIVRSERSLESLEQRLDARAMEREYCESLFEQLKRAEGKDIERLTDLLLGELDTSAHMASHYLQSYYLNLRNASIRILGETTSQEHLPDLQAIVDDGTEIHPAETIALAKEAIHRIRFIDLRPRYLNGTWEVEDGNYMAISFESRSDCQLSEDDGSGMIRHRIGTYKITDDVLRLEFYLECTVSPDQSVDVLEKGSEISTVSEFKVRLKREPLTLMLATVAGEMEMHLKQ